MIYLDSAATSYHRPDSVAEAVAGAIRTMGNGSRGTHPAALAGARVIYETRELLAQLFHAPGPDRVAFTANSTESLNMAIKGIVRPGDRVAATALDHNSVLRPLYEMEERGAVLEIAGCVGQDLPEDDPLRRKGLLDYEALKAIIEGGVRAVVCTHASNLTGNLVDIRRIGQWCRRAGAVFIVDASQTAGIFPIDMEQDCIDILCFTGHKGLMGPQGTGGICLGAGIKLTPLLTGGSGIMTFSREHPRVMPTALEAGTLNGHGIAGLRAALLYLRDQGADALRRRELKAMEAFLRQAREIPRVKIYGDFSQEERGAIVALNLGDEDSGEVSDYLSQEYEIYTRGGGHCAPLMHRALGTEVQGAVRFSFSPFNTPEEARQAAAALAAYD
ncbi:MAG: aminotransferase class V-fold PLP-dependent enzyme [Enterocloster asparagiformis]|nr:aminotransferase class V-fold PLP-dependent enzyme [Enterocloster asparagiformis]